MAFGCLHVRYCVEQWPIENLFTCILHKFLTSSSSSSTSAELAFFVVFDDINGDGWLGDNVTFAFGSVILWNLFTLLTYKHVRFTDFVSSQCKTSFITNTNSAMLQQKKNRNYKNFQIKTSLMWWCPIITFPKQKLYKNEIQIFIEK